MNAMTRQELWQRLRERALVEGDMPQPDPTSSPWYGRAMLGIAGWIGALFLLDFVGIGFSFVMKSAAASLAVGALCCGGTYAIFRAARQNDFATQFGLAVSLAGQGVFIAGIINAFEARSVAAYLLIAAFEAALALLVPNSIHRVMTAAAAVIALTFALGRFDLAGAAPAIAAAGFAMVWLERRRWAVNGSLWRPLGYGLALALLYLEAMGRVGWRGIFMSSWQSAGGFAYWSWSASALTAAVFIWSVSRILENERIALASWAGVAAMAAAMLVGALSFVAPGVASALLILLLGFACGNRVLLGLGVIGLLGFVSHYYYQLQATLLFKSAVLAASGIVLLAARLAISKFFPLHDIPEESHA